MSKKYVYNFSEGNKDMRSLLGGKGANLAEMQSLGINVPPGLPLQQKAVTVTMKMVKELNLKY